MDERKQNQQPVKPKTSEQGHFPERTVNTEEDRSTKSEKGDPSYEDERKEAQAKFDRDPDNSGLRRSGSSAELAKGKDPQRDRRLA